MEWFVAPYLRGRVYRKDAQDRRWSEPAQADEPGWYWWDLQLRAVSRARSFEILGYSLCSLECIGPMKGLRAGREVGLEFAQGVPRGAWVKAWWNGSLAFFVDLARGPTPRRERCLGVSDFPKLVRAAVVRGGGELLSLEPRGEQWTVRWQRAGSQYASIVDRKLNVVGAGFCLSGQDNLQDLASLVSLVEGKESESADPLVWRGNAGW